MSTRSAKTAQNPRRSARLAAKKPNVVEKPKSKPIVSLPPPLEEVYSDYSDNEFPIYPSGVKIKNIEEPKEHIKKEPVETKKEPKEHIKKEPVQKLVDTKKEPKEQIKKEPVEKPVDIKKDTPNLSFGTYLDNGKALSEMYEHLLLQKTVDNLFKDFLYTDYIPNGKSPFTLMYQEQFVKKMLDEYLSLLQNTKDTLRRVQIMIEMFEMINTKFDIITSSKFDNERRLIPIIHQKTISFTQEIKNLFNIIPAQKKNDINMLNSAINILDKVHTKCHLYGIDKSLTDDPIYKNFLSKFIDKYV